MIFRQVWIWRRILQGDSQLFKSSYSEESRGVAQPLDSLSVFPGAQREGQHRDDFPARSLVLLWALSQARWNFVSNSIFPRPLWSLSAEGGDSGRWWRWDEHIWGTKMWKRW